MKTRPGIFKFALLFSAAALLSLPAKADNIIRQTMLSSGVQYDIVTQNDSGNTFSYLPMAAGGASFELFAYGSAWDTNLYFLDRKVIGHYLPNASISVQSEDNWHQWINPNQPPRTRADKPFTLAITVSGLVSDPTAPEAAKKVLYTRVGQNYQDTYTPGDNSEYVLNSLLMGNQQPSFNPVYTLLTPMAPTKAMGIETFTISSLADETIPETSILAEEMLVVWPVSEATFDGIEDGQEIRDSLPNVVINYKDLYPLSMTYVQIYAGPPNLGTGGAVLATSLRWHNTIVPQNEIISVENWENMIPDDGEYTLEVLTVTPFDNWQPERLAHLSFTVDRKVRINGQVTTSED